MADISAELAAIMSAVYGEDVRGSIHDAIDIINRVGEVTLTLGTAVTSSSSSTEGYYDGSVYININTDDVWKCNGLQWSLQGNMRGNTGSAATIEVGTVIGGQTASVTNSGTSSAAVFDFVLPKGDKGDTGDGLTASSTHSGTNTVVTIKNAVTEATIDTFNVPDGQTGPTGNGIASIAKTSTAGLVDTYTITMTSGSPVTYTVTNGADGTNGTNGVSPEVSISPVTGGNTVTITDVDHPSGQSFNVMNGTNGTNGTDGVSPEVTIGIITGGHSVTITDADHPSGQTFNVLDGTSGTTVTISGDALILS